MVLLGVVPCTGVARDHISSLAASSDGAARDIHRKMDIKERLGQVSFASQGFAA